ncbi:MAG: DUF2341 domain-containing protein [Desulfitobacteriaceae bacterium]|nr:DUF2341 domain-containing protein [Desulfitobacteriaceae bacterium]
MRSGKWRALLIVFLLVTSFFSLIVVMESEPVLASPNWWDLSWTRRRPIEISGSHPENYQIKIIVSYDSDMRSDYGDLRFLENESSGVLNYWVENYTTDNAIVWVRRFENSDNMIYLYYGNPSAVSQSDVTNTFIRVIDGAQPVVGSWHLDENSGTTAYDTSGNANDGTISGAIWVDGKFGKALSFDGVDDYVEILNSSSINPTNEISVSAWFKHEYDSWEWMAIVGKSSYVSGYLLWVQPSSSTVGISGLIYVAGTRYNVYSDVVPSKGVWYHACYTVKQGEMNIYVNGEWKAKTSISSGAFDTNTNPLRIAGQGNSWFKGIIDEVRIY